MVKEWGEPLRELKEGQSLVWNASAESLNEMARLMWAGGTDDLARLVS